MDTRPPDETTRLRLRREHLRSSVIAVLASLFGLSVVVVVLRPADQSVVSNVYGGPISPGTDARVRIDVQIVDGFDFPETVQATARLIAIDQNLEKRLTALGQCGIRIELAQGWSWGWSNSLTDVSPSGFGAVRKEPGCVGNTVVDLTEQVPSSIKAAYYWYPFDRLVYRVRAETMIILFDAEGSPGDVSDSRLATPELHFIAPGWRVTQRELPGSRGQTVTGTPGGPQMIRRTPGAGIVEAELTRPFAIQLSVVLFLLILLVAVLSITQFEALGDSLQVLIAVSVLLWTSREALVPGAPKLFLAVDGIFLGLALLVLGSIFLLGWRHRGKLGVLRDRPDTVTPASEDRSAGNVAEHPRPAPEGRRNVARGVSPGDPAPEEPKPRRGDS